jgi:hypothetical protein
VSESPGVAQIMRQLEIGTAIATEVLQEIAKLVQAGVWDGMPLEDGVLTKAAGCYMIYSDSKPPEEWPLPSVLWNPTSTRSDFLKALALYILEIARIDAREGW